MDFGSAAAAQFYASFREGDAHYAYLCQVATGLPALPAIVQSIRTGSMPPKAPLWDGLMALPLMRDQIVPRTWVVSQQAEHPEKQELKYFEPYNTRELNGPYMRYRPPEVGTGAQGEQSDQLHAWQKDYGYFYDVGTVFTMIAGLLNVLAIWDPWGGPATPTPTGEKEKIADDTPEKNVSKQKS